MFFQWLCVSFDNVVTLNYYPIKEAERTSKRYRSVGLGYLGLAEYLATHKLAYDSEEARTEVDRLFERYTYYTYRASIDIAKERGTYELYPGSEYSKGILLGRERAWFEKNTPSMLPIGKPCLLTCKKHGVRFAYHTAPAPEYFYCWCGRHHRCSPPDLQALLCRDESLSPDTPCRTEALQRKLLVLQRVHQHGHE
jgi:ribonucleotide reductase alpha subunit